MVLPQFHDGASAAALWDQSFRYHAHEGLSRFVERITQAMGVGSGRWAAIPTLLGQALLLLDTWFGLCESRAISALADGV